MQLMKNCFLAMLLLMLSACVSMPKMTDLSFDFKLAYALGTVTLMQQAAATELAAGRISLSRAQQVQLWTSQARQTIDLCRVDATKLSGGLIEVQDFLVKAQIAHGGEATRHDSVALAIDLTILANVKFASITTLVQRAQVAGRDTLSGNDWNFLASADDLANGMLADQILKKMK